MKGLTFYKFKIDKNFKSAFGDLKKRDDTFKYQMLGRLEADCEYYLGHGGRYAPQLWAKNERDHINEMKSLWNSFSITKKPQWLTHKQISKYEKEMLK